MPLADVKIMYYTFGKTAGVSVIQKAHRMCVRMTHAVGTEMARWPILRPSLYFSVLAGEVKQGTLKESGHIERQHTGMKCLVLDLLDVLVTIANLLFLYMFYTFMHPHNGNYDSNCGGRAACL